MLLLSEEGPDTLAEKARLFGIEHHPRFHVLLRRQVQASWPEVVGQSRQYCREHDLDVLVVDTFDKWTGLRGDDENKSGPVSEALEPLMRAAGDELAVVLISHQRKAPGDHGEAVRGSNALTGAVDVIVEVERVADVPHARVLYGTSRFVGTPEELAVELGDGGYEACGDVETVKQRFNLDRVVAVAQRLRRTDIEGDCRARGVPRGDGAQVAQRTPRGWPGGAHREGDRWQSIRLESIVRTGPFPTCGQ